MFNKATRFGDGYEPARDHPKYGLKGNFTNVLMDAPY
jgi:hypothetical protein